VSLKRFAIAIVSLLLLGASTLKAQSLQISEVTFELGMSKDEAHARCSRAGTLINFPFDLDSELLSDKRQRTWLGELRFNQGRLVRIEKYWIPRENTWRTFGSQRADLLGLALHQAAQSVGESAQCHLTTSQKFNAGFRSTLTSIACDYTGYERTIVVATNKITDRPGGLTRVWVDEVVSPRGEAKPLKLLE
jgi:hypothetical protein